MSLFTDEVREKIRAQLAGTITNAVRLVMFTQELECRFCSETKQLIIELAKLNDRIQAEVHDFSADAELARQYGIEMIPALIIMSEKDFGIRYYGLPFGYEFQTLIEGLKTVSSGTTDLSDKTKQTIRQIVTPVRIKVFVTLTCPNCPMAASMAEKFAFENDLIKTDIIDATEFPHLAQKYAVLGVPKIVINEKIEFMGAVPEETFLSQVLSATT